MWRYLGDFENSNFQLVWLHWSWLTAAAAAVVVAVVEKLTLPIANNFHRDLTRPVDPLNNQCEHPTERRHILD